jgi:acetyltransferase-like isoleucine patch superfamily enzyme
MLFARKLRHWVGNIIRHIVVFYYRQMGITIGKNVFISLGAWLDVRRGKIVIGDNVTITNGCKILSHDRAASLLGNGKHGQKTTIIGKRVFLGMNSVILAGVEIGDNSIIGAGSVISKNIPPGCVVVGSRLRIIKRFNNASGEWISVDEVL